MTAKYKFKTVGQPIRRNEDERLITGKGRFTDDFSLPNQTYTAMVRSAYPHAKLGGIDISAAMEAPGVIAVFTGEDLAKDNLGEIPHNPVPSTKYDVKLTGPGGTPVYIAEHFLLPRDRARFVGEALAMVIAETREQAYNAAELVAVDYEPLDWVADTEAATAPDSPRLWDALPDNLLVDARFGDQKNTDAAFARADHVVTDKYHLGRITGATMEPRAALGDYNAETGRYTLYAGSGGAVRQKQELAQVLGIKPDRVRVLSFDVGGNFGTRNRAFVEFGLVMWAAKKIGRPVKFRAERGESFLTDYQGRDLVTEVSLALDKDGKFLALRADNISNVGARCVSLSPLSKGCGLITGSYDIPYATLHARAVYTNTMSTQAFRSSGRPEVCFAIEHLIDKAVRELGFDRVELRRKNLVKPSQMPFTNAMGMQYDSGEYEKNMDRLLEFADFKGAAARKAKAKARGMLYGIGFSNYVESSIGSPKERADLIVRPKGVEVIIGTQPAGQGHETSFAQVTADLMSIPFDKASITIGDTDIVTAGGGTHSGRSMRHASAVISLGVTDLIVKGRGVMAQRFNVDPSTITYEEGVFGTGTGQKADWFELATLAREMSPEYSDGIKVRRDNEMHTPVFPNGTCMCEIEIDPETGGLEIVRYATIDDVGRCINPLIVHGQTHGGIAHGVGQALWEGCVIDPDTGQPLVAAFTDYGMPRSDNMPSFLTEIAQVISPTNPLGVKAGGEGGTTPAPAVIMSAMQDALADYGAPSIPFPITPIKIWNTIHKGHWKGAV